MRIDKKIPITVTLILILPILFYSSMKVLRMKSSKELTIFVASDTHYLAKDLTDNGQAFQTFIKDGDGREQNYIYEIMDAFAHDIKKKKPDILIISGDLTNNGEKESHLELAKRLKKIEKMGTSVYVIPGNHDILNPYARGFKGDKQYKVDYINAKDFSEIYGDFGYKEAISRDKASLSYLAAPSKDVWLLMVDTAQYANNLVLGSPQGDGRVAAETLAWIKQCSDLAKSKGAKLIAAMHHNLINHSETVKEGYTVNNSSEVVSLFKKCRIELALSGHIHLQDIKSYKDSEKQIYDIATGCISIYPQKYGILKYSPKTGFNYSTASVDVAGWSKQVGINDKNLNNFAEYSRNFYGDRIYSKVVSRLAITDLYSTEELQLMGETYKLLYLRYYEGVKDVGTDEIRKSPGFKLWFASEENTMQHNVIRLANTNGESNNKLHIPQ